MSSSLGELLGLCHFIVRKVTPASSSSGGKGGNGTLHEVNRSTTSLNSLGRTERDTRQERMGQRDGVRDAHQQTDEDSYREGDIKMDNMWKIFQHGEHNEK